MPTKKESLRILLITARADHGGGPRHILDLLRGLRERPLQFYIASPDQEPYAPLFQALTEKFFEIPPQSFSPFKLFMLRRVVKRAKIDVIHSHGRGAGVYSRLLGLLTGVPVLHTFHGIHREPSLKGRIKLWVDQVLAFLPFTPVFVSENERGEAYKFSCVRQGREGVVIENAVDTARFKGRQTVALSSGTNAPLHIGAFLRADPVKGTDLFLRLVQEVGPTIDSQPLTWSCAGISKEELSAFGKVPAHLQIHDRIAEPAAWLESLDIFVSPARNEGLPLGVLEAMAAGCVCILSDIPAHQSFARDDAALLFDPRTPTSFTQQLSRVRRESDLRQSLLAGAGNLITHRYSLSIFAEKIFSAYRQTNQIMLRSDSGRS